MNTPFRHIGSIFRKTSPIHLTFFVTKRCNARCPFCFYLKSSDNTVDSHEELSLDEINRISQSLGRLLWLSFSGGEIFLRNDLVDISRVFYRNNKPSIMLYPTNGLLPELIGDMTEQILSCCKKSVVTVKLSIDGCNGAHDALRNTPGSFDKTMQTYHRLRPLLSEYPNFELGVNTVFCSENQESMDEIIDYVNSLEQIRTHTISLVRGNLENEHYKEVDYEKYHHAIEKLEKNLKEKVSHMYRFRGARIKAAQDIIQRQLIHETLQDQRRLIPCYAGRLNIVLTENGEVYPCEILPESLGNVRDNNYNMGKLLQTGKAREMIQRIIENKCFCTHECYFMTNILFNPGMYPRLFKEYIQL